MKFFSHLCCVLFLSAFALRLSAQPAKKWGIQLIEQERKGQNLRLTVQKYGEAFILQIEPKKAGRLITIQNGSGTLLGKSTLQTKRGEWVWIIHKSVKGLTPLWGFSFAKLVSLQQAKTNGKEEKMDCQWCCYQAHLAELGMADEAYVAEQIEKGNGPQEWGWYYEIPPAAKIAYLACMSQCWQGESCE
ncbi:MAG: hypothetical protein AAF399_28035 [Bacteroidota bacterium]